MNNKVKTAGYLINRLKDAGFVVWKIFNCYNDGDARRWTILVDPGNFSVFITCYFNKDMIDGVSFYLDDGGQKFPEHKFIKTESAEVIIKTLIDAGVSNNPKHNKFFKENDN